MELKLDMQIDNKTIDFYNKEAKNYASWSSSNDRIILLKNFIKNIIKNGLILDYGCGSGWATSYFVSKGYKTTSLDPSINMLNQIKDNPKINKVCGDIFDLDRNNFFDGLWASFSIQHALRKNVPGIVSELNKCLKKDGKYYIGIHEGSKTIRDKLGRHYCYYKEEEIRDILINSGFKISGIIKEKSLSFDGNPINIMHIDGIKLNNL